MAKFYISTGNLNLVIEADHARAAAIWAVHRCLSEAMPFAGKEADEKPGRSFQAADSHYFLGDTIAVSERGFGGADEEQLATLPVVAEWSRLLLALDRLQQDFSNGESA
ncbi:hypothetical protein [Anatilimnocola floriformis]|uniref:hypothetical protein n=1 Tax=Anatilimnocola floriformis TaxID=2948575 RepID=UPI0020C4932E|nr:hypothetical protein [Anatilimnocola floriformis]